MQKRDLFHASGMNHYIFETAGVLMQSFSLLGGGGEGEGGRTVWHRLCHLKQASILYFVRFEYAYQINLLRWLNTSTNHKTSYIN